MEVKNSEKGKTQKMSDEVFSSIKFGSEKEMRVNNHYVSAQIPHMYTTERHNSGEEYAALY